MSLENHIWAMNQETGKTGAKFLLVVLADYADSFTGHVSYLDAAKLATLTDQTVQSIYLNINYLCDCGFLHLHILGNKFSDRVYILGRSIYMDQLR